MTLQHRHLSARINCTSPSSSILPLYSLTFLLFEPSQPLHLIGNTPFLLSPIYSFALPRPSYLSAPQSACQHRPSLTTLTTVLLSLNPSERLIQSLLFGDTLTSIAKGSSLEAFSNNIPSLSPTWRRRGSVRDPCAERGLSLMRFIMRGRLHLLIKQELTCALSRIWPSISNNILYFLSTSSYTSNQPDRDTILPKVAFASGTTEQPTSPLDLRQSIRIPDNSSPRRR